MLICKFCLKRRSRKSAAKINKKGHLIIRLISTIRSILIISFFLFQIYNYLFVVLPFHKNANG